MTQRSVDKPRNGRSYVSDRIILKTTPQQFVRTAKNTNLFTYHLLIYELMFYFRVCMHFSRPTSIEFFFGKKKKLEKKTSRCV